MHARTAKLLHDALSASGELQQFTQGRSFEEYQSDRPLQLITERLFATLGEALNQAWRTDDRVAVWIPEARRVIGMRNRIIHGYDNVEDAILWEAAIVRLPSLRKHLQAALDQYAPE